MKQYARHGFRLGLAAFAVATATLIADESHADFDLGQGIVLAPSAQIPVPPGVTSEPLSVTVNCSGGGTVAQALALKPLTNNRLTITINGTCTEAVDLGYSRDVTLQGGSSGGGLQAPSSSTDPVLDIRGQAIILNNLTISGGVEGVVSHAGGSFTGSNVVIEGASNIDLRVSRADAELDDSVIQSSANIGADVVNGSSLILNGGTVQGNVGTGVNVGNGGHVYIEGGLLLQNNGGSGGLAFDGGSIWVEGGTVQNNGTAGVYSAGLLADAGGAVQVQGSNSSVVNNVLEGVAAIGGGVVTLNGGIVANNSGHGVHVTSGGTAFIFGGAIVQSNTLNGVNVANGNLQITGGTVQNNKGNGIYLGLNSVGSFPGPATSQIINNSLWGILCAAAPSNPLIAANGKETVSGNGSGQISCNTGN